DSAGPPAASRGPRVTGTGAGSGALGDRVDLVGDEPVRLAVHRRRGVRVRRVDQAKDLAMLLVDPIPQVVNAVGVLGVQVGGVCLRHVVDRDRAINGVRIHEQCHGRVLLGDMGLIRALTGNPCRTGRHIGGLPYLGWMTPSRSAVATARDRVGSPSLRSTAETWWPTVFSERKRRPATSAQDSP